MNIYIDESGFTGYNLLDPQQPAFAIASTNIGPDEAEQLLREAFPNYAGAEYKFSNIVGSRNQVGLRKLGDLLGNAIDRTFTYIFDKKFTVFAKMVDFLIEPPIRNAGYDFYANGFCRKYTNFVYVAMRFVNTVNLYDDLVNNYMTFSRNPSAASLSILRRQLIAMEKAASLEAKGPLAQMIMGAEILAERFDLDWYRSTNETQFTTMIAVVGRWRQRYTDDFHIIHDNTSNFLRRREDWEAITNPTVPEQLHPLGDGTNVQFPLRVIETVGVDSAENYAIQLCDILAGFSTQYFKQKWSGATDHPVQLIAEETGLGQLSHSGMMFEQDFPEGDPLRANGPDAVDLMTRIITGNNRV